MKDTLTETAPPRLWLQVDTGASNDYRDEPFPSDIDGVTWHNEEIGGLEVEYVRSDIAAGLLEALRGLLVRCSAEMADPVDVHEIYAARVAIAKATGAV